MAQSAPAEKLSTSKSRLEDIQKTLRTVHATNYYRWVLILIFSLSSFLLIYYLFVQATEEPKNLSVLFGASMQAAVVVAILSFLVVRRSDLDNEDMDVISKTANKIDASINELDSLKQELYDIMASEDLPVEVAEGLSLKDRRTIQAAKGLTVKAKRIAIRYAEARAQIDNLVDEIVKIDWDVRSWKMSWERIVAGIFLALICLISSALPLLEDYSGNSSDISGGASVSSDSESADPGSSSASSGSESASGTTRTRSREDNVHPSGKTKTGKAIRVAKSFIFKKLTPSYISLASISALCASFSFGMLGRRKTDEAKFLNDITKVTGAVAVLRDIVGREKKA